MMETFFFVEGPNLAGWTFQGKDHYHWSLIHKAEKKCRCGYKAPGYRARTKNFCDSLFNCASELVQGEPYTWKCP